MSFGRILLLSALVSIAFGSFPSPARSSCAAPQLVIAQEDPYTPGQTLSVTARAWTGDCNDVISGCASRPAPARPGTNTVLLLRPVDDTTGRSDIVLLEGIDADEDLRFHVEVTLPDVPKGRYSILGLFSGGLGGTAAFKVRDG